MILSIIPSVIYIAYLLFAGVLLESNSVISLFETNPEESKEFIANYLSLWVNIAMGIYVAIPIIMIIRMKPFKPLQIKEHKALFITSIITLILLLSVPFVSKYIYIFNFYDTFISYKLRLSLEEKKIGERQNLNYTVKTSETDTIPQTIILVIGESETRNHMQIYGYERQTTPNLTNRNDNLFAYTDVISPQVHTIPVIRSVLSHSEKENPEFFYEKPSLFELFNRAGFETYFISNQPFGGKVKTSYDVLIKLAQHKYNLSKEKKHDGILLPVIKNIISTNTTKNKLIVVHLIGNHMAYEFRYPKDFAIFDYKKDLWGKNAPYINNEAKKTIDTYDNSVLYNDYILNEIIKMLEIQDNKENIMIYFSDHGEELYDKRDFAGHAYEKISPYMCEIPFIIWVSDSYKREREDIVFDVDRPYSTSDFIYSISDLAGLEYTDLDKSRSIFSKTFKPQDRYVGDMTYDEVLKLR